MSIKRLHCRATRWVLLSTLGLPATGAMAAEWSKEGSVSVGGIYTDNVELDDNNKEGEFITTMTPRISLQGEGNRANLDLDAAVQINDLGGRTDNVSPRLDADGEVELVQSHLFLEADASAYQSAADPFSATGASSLNRNGNSVTTYNYAIGPVFRTRLTDFADLELRYRYDEQRFGGERRDELDESTQQMTSFSLNSGDLFSRFTWSLSGDRREIEFSEDREITDPLLANRDDDIERKTLRFSPAYRLSRKWQLTGTIGKEWNDFDTGDPDAADDEFWNAGFVWTPSLRTTVRAGYGERFFGTTPYAEIEHRTRRTVLSFGYSRDLTDTRSLRRREDVIPDLDPFGDPIDPVTGEPLPIDEFFTSRANSVVVNERWDATLTVQGNRTTVRLSARQSNQTREDLSGEDSTFRFLQASVERSLSARLSANARISWDEREREDTQTEGTDSSDILRISFGANYELGPRTRVNMLYTHSRADEGLFSSEYQENRISVNLTYQLF